MATTVTRNALGAALSRDIIQEAIGGESTVYNYNQNITALSDVSSSASSARTIEWADGVLNDIRGDREIQEPESCLGKRQRSESNTLDWVHTQQANVPNPPYSQPAPPRPSEHMPSDIQTLVEKAYRIYTPPAPIPRAEYEKQRAAKAKQKKTTPKRANKSKETAQPCLAPQLWQELSSNLGPRKRLNHDALVAAIDKITTLLSVHWQEIDMVLKEHQVVNDIQDASSEHDPDMYSLFHAAASLCTPVAYVGYHYLHDQYAANKATLTPSDMLLWHQYQAIAHHQETCKTLVRKAILALKRDYKNIYHMYREIQRYTCSASEVADRARQNIIVQFVEGTNWASHADSLGKFLVDGSEDVSKIRPAIAIPGQPDPEYYVLHSPEYVDLDDLNIKTNGKPFAVAVINRQELETILNPQLRDCIKALPQKTPLKKGQFDLNKVMHEYPRIIETVVIDTGDAHVTKRGNENLFHQLLRKLHAYCQTAVQSRKQWGRGGTGNGRGGAVSINSRVDHWGELDKYNNFVNQIDTDKKARLLVGEEMGVDYAANLARGVLPDIVNAMFLRAAQAGLPPRGTRAFSVSGAATINYIAAQHVERLIDPLWTIGLCLYRSAQLGQKDLAFGFAGLHGGRGLIIKPSKRNRPYCWMWKGAVNAHGGVVSSHTFEAAEDQNTPHSHATLALYQKQQPLNYGHKFLRGVPESAEVYVGRDIDKQNGRYQLGWVVVPQGIA